MLDLFLSNPLNLVLLMPLVYFLYTAIYPPLPPKGARRPTSHEAGYDWMPAEHPESVLYRQYTARELAPFDGKEDKDGKPGKILLAIERRERVRNAEGGWNMERKERTVFDVSAGRSFYGPDGPYGNFAGRDASRGMAMQSFEEDMLTPLDKPLDKLDDLDKEQEDNMNNWHSHFSNKYVICGELVEETAGDNVSSATAT